MTTLGRRLTAEWEGLERLALANPGRLFAPSWNDLVFSFQLQDVPTVLAAPDSHGGLRLRRTHAARLEFSPLFPATPMALYLDSPVWHPNIHPQTGFVCVWDTHRVGHTAEQAIHKAVAMLGWQLANPEAVHVMQPDALEYLTRHGEAVRAQLRVAPLRSTGSSTSFLSMPARQRQRLT